MEIKKQVILRTVAGEHMLVPIGDTVFEYNGIFMLTESGKLLWESIRDGAETEELINMIVDEFDIDTATATADVNEFLGQLRGYGII